MDANGFPVYPDVDDLPAGMSEHEQYEFAFRLIAEHGERLGDYLVAATMRALRDEAGVKHPELFQRWMAMSDRIERIIGEPITLTYRYCDRLAAERGDVATGNRSVIQ